LASSANLLLYNPFWRVLSNQPLYDHQSAPIGHLGTCFYSKDKHSKWKVFDQILFSKHFIGGGQWRLQEHEIRVMASKKLTSKNADHLPIFAAIERGFR
jgi:hypothetical protein